MDAELSRSRVVKTRDPHDWNSFDHYCTIHEKRLAEHPSLDESKPNTLAFDSVEREGVLHVVLSGLVYCKRDVVLEVEKWFETRFRGQILQVKGVLYRYVAWVEGGYPVLRYHNLHENDNYVHRAFNPRTGEEILYEVLTREQFPHLSDVLDEIGLLTRRYLD